MSAQSAGKWSGPERRMAGDERLRTASVCPTHACFWRLVWVYEPRASFPTSPRFRSETMAPSLAAQSQLALSRNSTVLRNAVISGWHWEQS